MITEMKTIQIVKTMSYWTCACENHRHIAKHIAEACLKRYPSGTGDKKKQKLMREALEDKIQAFVWYINGTKTKDIAEKLGISYGRANEHIKFILRQISVEKVGHYGYRFPKDKASLRSQKDDLLSYMDAIRKRILNYIDTK